MKFKLPSLCTYEAPGLILIQTHAGIFCSGELVHASYHRTIAVGRTPCTAARPKGCSSPRRGTRWHFTLPYTHSRWDVRPKMCWNIRTASGARACLLEPIQELREPQLQNARFETLLIPKKKTAAWGKDFTCSICRTPRLKSQVDRIWFGGGGAGL